MTSGLQKLTLALLAIAFLAVAAVQVCRQQGKEMMRPRVTWDENTLRVSSPKDGPWVITHLIKLRDGASEYAVARLPAPATIIDSRGERYTLESIQALPWITRSGATSPPPAIGHPMKAFYFVPEESR